MKKVQRLYKGLENNIFKRLCVKQRKIATCITLSDETFFRSKIYAYFPSKINSFNDLLKVNKKISIQDCLTEKDIKIPDFSTKLENKKNLLTDKPLKLLLIDLSTYYVKEGDNIILWLNGINDFFEFN